MMNAGGVRVSPIEVEAALNAIDKDPAHALAHVGRRLGRDGQACVD